MRTVGQRKQHAITHSASGALLEEGARFNDEMHRLPGGSVTHIPKGVFRFMRHEDADRQLQHCLASAMAQIARSHRSDGKI